MKKYKLNLKILKHNQITFGTRGLGAMAQKIKNTLPYHIKTSEN